MSYSKIIDVTTGDSLIYNLYVTAYQLTNKETTDLSSIIVLKTYGNRIPYAFCDYNGNYLYVWTDAPNIDVKLKLTFRCN